MTSQTNKFKEDDIFEEPEVLRPEDERALPREVVTLIKVEDREMRTKLRDFKVANKEQYEVACELGTANARVLKRIEDERKKITAPMNAALKAVNDLFKRFSSRFQEYDEFIRKRMAQYQSTVKRDAIQNVNTDTGRATIQERWDFEVVDEAKVPREWLMVDTTKIGRAVRSGSVQEIPGIKIFKKKVTTFAS